MPEIWIPEVEWAALRSVLRGSQEPIDWDAYDRAKRYLLLDMRPQEVPIETASPEPQGVES
jgi:hypothetical protein